MSDGVHCVGVQLALEAPFVIPADILVGKCLKGLDCKIESQSLIEISDGKSEFFHVSLVRDGLSVALPQYLIEDFNAQPGVVKQRAVPIPDYVPIFLQHQ